MKTFAALAAGLALAVAAGAQPAQNADQQQACEQARDASAGGDALVEATYANCLASGLLREPNALAHARELARASMKQGSEIGAFALYAAYTADPDFNYMTGGKADMAKYGALAALPIESRAEQIEALEALGFAYSKGYPKAVLSLTAYFFETVAPKNVVRVRNLAALMRSRGLHAPFIDQLHNQAAQIAALGDTKASVRAFSDAQGPATFAAGAILAKSAPACEQVKLVHIESGPLKDAVFLPLKSAALHDTYLVKGTWDETWQFEGCGREARLTMQFTADGWGGANFHSQIAPAKQ